jgi:hypothetical protein
MEEESDLISKEAEIFRSKIISDFHLLEHIIAGSDKKETPCLYTSDITGKQINS